MKNSNSNNFYNGEVIVSYDSNKIWEEEVGNNIIFYKKTDINEFKNIKKMKKLLKNKYININNRNYKLMVPNVYNWDSDNRILSMEFIKGRNLEFYLRDKNTYEEGQLILNNILEFLISNKIFWLDFAARNIIVGENKIWFVDFEKGFARKNIKIKDYLRNHVYEEYCIFLFTKDRKYNMDYILNLDNERNNVYNINEINCSRCYNIARLLGYNDSITKKEYLDILKMIISVQEPIIDNNSYYFSCVDLDKIFSNNSKENALDEYCKTIISLYERNKM